jgi:hypothetical protein
MARMGEVEWIWIYIFVVGGKGGGEMSSVGVCAAGSVGW